MAARDRVVKPAAWLLGLTPLAVLAAGGIGVDPIETVTHLTGFWALTLLMASLAVSPLRRVTGWNALIGARKVLGLFAFFYAVLHFATYLVDQSFSWGFIVADVVEHWWVTVGFAALLLLVPLALTSTKGAIRRMGKRWQKLHRLVYVAAGLGVLHFFLLVKKDVTEPLIFAGVFAALMAFRYELVTGGKKRAAGRTPRTAGEPTRVP
ncbi:MAG: sulfoxide reductase heme-binding subunit YedZ [Gemmatimonadetes bacterium]|nr:sulfoxide reductase heme-binding subunit YedZ [Gemmatimonadota bacterium]